MCSRPCSTAWSPATPRSALQRCRTSAVLCAGGRARSASHRPTERRCQGSNPCNWAQRNRVVHRPSLERMLEFRGLPFRRGRSHPAALADVSALLGAQSGPSFRNVARGGARDRLPIHRLQPSGALKADSLRVLSHAQRSGTHVFDSPRRAQHGWIGKAAGESSTRHLPLGDGKQHSQEHQTNNRLASQASRLPPPPPPVLDDPPHKRLSLAWLYRALQGTPSRLRSEPAKTRSKSPQHWLSATNVWSQPLSIRSTLAQI